MLTHSTLVLGNRGREVITGAVERRRAPGLLSVVGGLLLLRLWL